MCPVANDAASRTSMTITLLAACSLRNSAIETLGAAARSVSCAARGGVSAASVTSESRIRRIPSSGSPDHRTVFQPLAPALELLQRDFGHGGNPARPIVESLDQM